MSERPITPFAPFDSESIPKAPRIPSDIDQLQRRDIEARDTDKTPPEDAVDDADADVYEKTPVRKTETTVEMVLRRLGEMEVAGRDSKKMQQRIYSLLLKIDSDNKVERRKRIALARRVTTLEATRQWLPALAWLVCMLTALAALLRTYR